MDRTICPFGCSTDTSTGFSIVVPGSVCISVSGQFVASLTHHCLDRLRLTKAPHRQLRVICAIHYLSTTL
eukprot:SAG11_NODE_36816_length_259_cov_4.437500_1_plen_69_part_10